MAFESNYKKNSYNKPLLIFVWLNHHYRTIVFAVALLYDETEETYTWVLEEFLECMKNKPPPVVVTDGDHAIAKAIQKVFPTSVHRLCAWHLQNNVTINAPHPVFKSKFNELLYQYCTEEDFEDTWNRMVSEFEFEDSQWATTTYSSRRSWAECFLRGHFFGGVRTTQRSESINSYLSHILTSKLKLRDLVGQVDKAIQSIRHTEWEDKFISNHSTPQLPSNILQQYYDQVASILTRNMYKKVEEQITSALAYSVDSTNVSIDFRFYSLTKFPKGLVQRRVCYYIVDGHINSTCMLFESDGIPYRQIFAVMKHLNIPCIPESLYKDRRKKDAKNTIGLKNLSHSRVPPDVLVCTRWGSLTLRFNAMGYYATKHNENFEEAMNEMSHMEQKFKSMSVEVQSVDQVSNVTPTNNRDHPPPPPPPLPNRGIRDPTVVRTNGRETNKSKSKEKDTENGRSRKNRCRNCNQLGHNKATCKSNPAAHTIEKDYEPSCNSPTTEAEPWLYLMQSQLSFTGDKNIKFHQWYSDIPTSSNIGPK
ncbi:protein FAR1-RELATED SEQUENCE 5-like [Humulus lupulus]|uniref:protein FAR1-RELATED SEQUENCE 5-like n=1 Tax=Humulus lupulus TaxID=3486 RepID=UPI002B404D58|nr:protein FAR1-RELATED SEQUENCE 5-like [Humulus lupulus]